jgi:putative spermidine/putrescine transport system permease protein
VTDAALPRISQDAPPGRPGRRYSRNWIGLVPFMVFSTMFLLIPTIYLIIGSFLDSDGQFTVQNYADLTDEIPLNAYLTSIEVSLVTAIAGGIFGFLMAYAVIGGGPSIIRISKTRRRSRSRSGR